MITPEKTGVAITDFADLSQAHHELDALFTEHQVALIHFEIEKSLQLLASFRSAIEEHIRFEEEDLIPLYGELGGDNIEGGRVDFYLKEHRKILKLLDVVEEAFSQSSIRRDGDGARRILDILEMEHSLKALLTHHDQREESFLYPFLDKVTSRDQKRTLLSRTDLPIRLRRIAETRGK